MGKAIIAFFQRGLDLIAPKSPPEPSPMVGGYKVDYNPLSAEEIAAHAEGDGLLETGIWIPVNRKS
jgi:hypothetical protein